MSMKQKLASKRIQILLLAVVIILVAVVIGALWITREDPSVQADAELPEFIFHSQQVQGWWSSGNTPPEYEHPAYPEDLVAAMNVLEGEQHTPSDCFAMFLYRDTPVDPSAALQNMEKRTVGNTPTVLRKLDARTAKLKIFGNEREFELQSYDLQGEENTELKRGIAFGYLPLEDRHVEVRAYCDNHEGLARIEPVFSAIELKQ